MAIDVMTGCGDRTVSGCCPDESVVVPIDFSATGIGIADEFLQRAGYRVTPLRGRPRIEPKAHRIHTLPLSPPLPLPELQYYIDGPCPPDRGTTYPWPHPP